MTAGPFNVYEKGELKIHQQSLDWINDTFVALVLDTAHTPDLAAHEFISDVVANECADGDYARVTISGKTLAMVANKIRYGCAKIDFGDAVTINGRYCVIAKNTGVDATSPLLFICDGKTEGGNLQSTGSDFDFTPNANGLHEFNPNG